MNDEKLNTSIQSAQARLLKIDEELERLKKKKKQLASDISAKKRKQRNHRLIILGGIVAKYLQTDLSEIDDDTFKAISDNLDVFLKKYHTAKK